MGYCLLFIALVRWTPSEYCIIQEFCLPEICCSAETNDCNSMSSIEIHLLFSQEIRTSDAYSLIQSYNRNSKVHCLICESPKIIQTIMSWNTSESMEVSLNYNHLWKHCLIFCAERGRSRRCSKFTTGMGNVRISKSYIPQVS
jgi:hypothetical protein